VEESSNVMEYTNGGRSLHSVEASTSVGMTKEMMNMKQSTFEVSGVHFSTFPNTTMVYNKYYLSESKKSFFLKLTSPGGFYRIFADKFVRSQKYQIFNPCLTDKHSVKRIAMNMRQ